MLLNEGLYTPHTDVANVFFFNLQLFTKPHTCFNLLIKLELELMLCSGELNLMTGPGEQDNGKLEQAQIFLLEAMSVFKLDGLLGVMSCRHQNQFQILFKKKF